MAIFHLNLLSVAMFVFYPLHQLRKLVLFENRACTHLPEQVEEMLLLLSSFLQWMGTETDQCKIEGDIFLIFHFGVLTK